MALNATESASSFRKCPAWGLFRALRVQLLRQQRAHRPRLHLKGPARACECLAGRGIAHKGGARVEGGTDAHGG
eukprot:14583870-Alexandrium_andersonii.AAC.1